MLQQRDFWDKVEPSRLLGRGQPEICLDLEDEGGPWDFQTEEERQPGQRDTRTGALLHLLSFLYLILRIPFHPRVPEFPSSVKSSL